MISLHCPRCDQTIHVAHFMKPVSCPHCGAPVPAPRTGSSNAWIIGAAVLGSAVVVILLIVVICVAALAIIKETSPSQPKWQNVGIDGVTQIVRSNDGTCELAVPVSWKPMALNKIAQVQMGDETQARFVLVIVESKEDFPKGTTLRNYGDLILQGMREKKNQLTVTRQEVDVNIGGLNGIQVEYTLPRDAVTAKIQFLVTFIEGKDHFYQILSWTLASHFAAASPQFKLVANSFHEVIPLPGKK